MGLLTNPNNGDDNKILQLLKKHHGKIGILSYFTSIVWVIFLANPSYNMKTYFSENALLPGLVVEHFDEGPKIHHYISELHSNDTTDTPLTPQDFISIFNRIGLTENEIQTFTLTHPVTGYGEPRGRGVTTGSNVFAVLRAKRAAGTESIIFNTPYFPRNGVGRRNLPAIATMLALAEYFRDQVYWAKDIVFLIADSHIGSLAWVKGHHEVRSPNENLEVDSVRVKVGNIQAALNFVLDGNKVCTMETKFHGLNGQLPNLDLVNLLNKFLLNVREQNRLSNWEEDVWKLGDYMLTQGTGSTTGSHGFFLKYGIESVTLFGKTGNCRRPVHFVDIGRILEASFRSLNNLLERFHQSFFFYLKTSTHRFVSIGLYFPPLGLMLLAIPLKATAIWLTEQNLEATVALFLLTVIHFVSIGFRWLLSHLEVLPYSHLQMTPLSFSYLVLGLGMVQCIFIQVLLRLQSIGVRNAVYCFVLLEMGVTLYTLGLFNPSLVFIVAVVTVPLVTFLFLGHPSRRQGFYIRTFGVFIVLTAVLIEFNLESIIQPLINKYFYESEIYGNLLFDFVFTLLVPLFSSILALM